MKAFTIAAALDAGADHDAPTRSSTTTISGSAASGSRMPIAPTTPGATAEITPGDVLALSNNVGAAKIGLELGGEELYEAFLRFGFGAPTGIELAGEASGVVWDPDGPNASGELTAAQNAFGQGLSLTAVQLAAGYASFANGGTAGHAARRRGLDRSGRHRTTRREQPPRRADHARRNRRHDARPADERDRRRHRQGRSDPRLHRRRQDRHGADRRTGAGRRTRTARSSSSGVTSTAGSTPASSDSCPAGDPKLVTLVLMHRPASWGRYQHGRTARDRVCPAHAPGARLSRHPAGPPARTGGAAMRLLDSPEFAAWSVCLRPIRLDELLAVTGGRLLGSGLPSSRSPAHRSTPGA